MVYIDKNTGKKLYPVCNWEDNQHKLYNAHDRILNSIYDAEQAGDKEKAFKGYEAQKRIEHAINAFDSHVIGGLVYATWEDGQIIKDYIWAYNARH